MNINHSDEHDRGQVSLRLILLLTLAIAALFLILCFPTFETSDDATIIRMVDGSKGSTDPHLIYQNVILGCFYILLYKLPLRLPWYSLFQILMILISMSVLAWCITVLLGRRKGIIMAVMTDLFLGYECIVQIQYTKTAGLAACAGMMLILCCGRFMDRKAHSRKAILYGTGIGLIVYGSMLRFAQAAVCVALMGGGALYLLLYLVSEKRKTSPDQDQDIGTRDRITRLIGVLFAALVIVLLCFGIDSFSYRFGRLSGFKRFDAARIELLDHGMPDYDENEGELKAMGIRRSAYRLLKGWTFADPDVFTAGVLEQIASLKEPVDYVNRDRIRKFVSEVAAGMLRRRFFWLFLATLLIWLFAGRHDRKDLLCALYGAAAFTAMYYYLYCNGRYLVNRVDVPMLLSLGMTFLFMTGASYPSGTQPERHFSKSDLLTGTCAFAMILIVMLSPSLRPDLQLRGGERASMFRTYAERSRQLLRQASDDPEHLYLAKLYTISDDYAFGVFDTAPVNCLANILWLGGWSYRTGCYLNIMERYGITNPMRDMIDAEDVLLVDHQVDRTLRYLRSYVQKDVDASEVSTIGDFPVYRVTTGNGAENHNE